MLSKYPRIPHISSNIQLFAEIMNDICVQIFLRDVCPLPISKTQLHILKTLLISTGKSASDLSSILHLSRPAITQQIDKLCSLKLVTRHTDPNDRRAVNIKLTEQGKDIISNYEEYVLARHANILNYFSYEDRETFNRGLEKFIDLCLDNVDNLDVLCLNCEGRFEEYCKIQQHKHFCHLENRQQKTT